VFNKHPGFNYIKAEDGGEYLSIGGHVWYKKNNGKLCNYKTNEWLYHEWRINEIRKDS
tara:strand:+ start:365 stop:538 length:174 start_codon:yes stop_codon:yes gene_type:complete